MRKSMRSFRCGIVLTGAGKGGGGEERYWYKGDDWKRCVMMTILHGTLLVEKSDSQHQM